MRLSANVTISLGVLIIVVIGAVAILLISYFSAAGVAGLWYPSTVLNVSMALPFALCPNILASWAILLAALHARGGDRDWLF